MASKAWSANPGALDDEQAGTRTAAGVMSAIAMHAHTVPDPPMQPPTPPLPVRDPPSPLPVPPDLPVPPVGDPPIVPPQIQQRINNLE
jgi:hypothetical protein